MKVFKREEIPDFYHIKNATYALDLLILPNINNVSLSTVDNDHPYLYLPPLLGDESDESDVYQAKGKDHTLPRYDLLCQLFGELRHIISIHSRGWKGKTKSKNRSN